MARPRRIPTGFFNLNADAMLNRQSGQVNAPQETGLATTVLLLCAAPVRRQGAFAAADDAADDATVQRVMGQRAAGVPDRFARNVFASPFRSAQQTAAALGLAVVAAPALADLDHGRWAGCALDDLQTRDPEALLAWLADPTLGAPGGEAMAAARARIGDWLDAAANTPGALCAITHPMMIRAALAHALDLPLRATLAIDIAPLSRTVLSFNRTWRLQSLGCPG